MKRTLVYVFLLHLISILVSSSAEPEKTQNNFKLKFEKVELKKVLVTDDGALKGKLCIFLVGEVKNISNGNVYIGVVDDSNMISRSSYNYYCKKSEKEDWQSMWHAGSAIGGKLMKIPPGGALSVNRFIARSDISINDTSPRQERAFTDFGVMIRIFGADKIDGDNYLMLESIIKLGPAK